MNEEKFKEFIEKAEDVIENLHKVNNILDVVVADMEELIKILKSKSDA